MLIIHKTGADDPVSRAVLGAVLSEGESEGSDPESDGAEPADGDKVKEEYDSFESAVGSVNPLDEVEFEGKTKDPGLIEQGFTENGLRGFGRRNTIRIQKSPDW